jgi:hypothetical protein
MPWHASAVPGITQATSSNWMGPDALWAMVRTLENPTTTAIGWDQMLYGQWSEHWRILPQQHLYNNNISCNPRNNDIGWITGHHTLIWNELYSGWKLWNQDRHGKEEELQRQIKLDQAKRQIRVLYHLQPLCNLTNHRKWLYANPKEHFLHEPSLTSFKTGSQHMNQSSEPEPGSNTNSINKASRR